jgi:hypothetical protein
VKRTLLGGVIVILAAMWATPAQGASRSPADSLFPPRVFGHVKHARCVTDPRGDLGFFNGKAPGRHDASVDILRACGATIDATAHDVTRLEDDLPCGPMPTNFVVCSKGVFSPGELLLFSMQVAGPVAPQLPLSETARYSLFIDAGGDLKTKAKASADGPDLASQGTNVTYQIIFNDPGTTVQDVGILAIDRRKASEFFQTSARVWFNKDKVAFVIPKSEIGDVKAVRGGSFLGSRAAQGDASQGAQDVVPGGRHAPFALIPYSG